MYKWLVWYQIWSQRYYKCSGENTNLCCLQESNYHAPAIQLLVWLLDRLSYIGRHFYVKFIEREILDRFVIYIMRSLLRFVRRGYIRVCKCNETMLRDWQSYLSL
jgi:hypothetical protein